jgi:hypothetical protein
MVGSAGKFAVSEAVREVVPEWPIGETIACPVCGRPGKASITTAKGARERYVYRVVYHSASERCVIKGAIAKVTESGEVVRVEGGRGRRVQRRAERAAAPITAFAQAPAEGAPAQAPVEEEVKPVEGAVEVPIYREWGPIPEGVDKAAWYAVKVAASWGSVRENPTEENFNRFASTARQVAVRIGVPVEDAVSAVEAYVKTRSEQAKIRANEAVKFVVARIMVASTAQIETFAEEVRKRVEEAVRRIEEVAKVPEVKVSSEDYAAMHAVFRQKKSVPEEVRERAYRKWKEVFSPGRKVVSVEGQPA